MAGASVKSIHDTAPTGLDALAFAPHDRHWRIVELTQVGCQAGLLLVDNDGLDALVSEGFKSRSLQINGHSTRRPSRLMTKSARLTNTCLPMVRCWVNKPSDHLILSMCLIAMSYPHWTFCAVRFLRSATSSKPRAKPSIGKSQSSWWAKWERARPSWQWLRFIRMPTAEHIEHLSFVPATWLTNGNAKSEQRFLTLKSCRSSRGRTC